MRKTVHVIATSLAAVAIIGGTSAAASAAPADRHDGFGRHGSFDRHTFRSAYHHAYQQAERFAHEAPAHLARAGHDVHAHHVLAPEATPVTTNRHATRHDEARPDREAASFAQRKARVVARLTERDNRLALAQAELTNAAANVTTGGYVAPLLTYVTQEKQHVDAQLAAAKAATNDQELQAALVQ